MYTAPAPPPTPPLPTGPLCTIALYTVVCRVYWKVYCVRYSALHTVQYILHNTVYNIHFSVYRAVFYR